MDIKGHCNHPGSRGNGTHPEAQAFGEGSSQQPDKLHSHTIRTEMALGQEPRWGGALQGEEGAPQPVQLALVTSLQPS